MIERVKALAKNPGVSGILTVSVQYSMGICLCTKIIAHVCIIVIV